MAFGWLFGCRNTLDDETVKVGTSLVVLLLLQNKEHIAPKPPPLPRPARPLPVPHAHSAYNATGCMYPETIEAAGMWPRGRHVAQCRPLPAERHAAHR